MFAPAVFMPLAAVEALSEEEEDQKPLAAPVAKSKAKAKAKAKQKGSSQDASKPKAKAKAKSVMKRPSGSAPSLMKRPSSAVAGAEASEGTVNPPKVSKYLYKDTGKFGLKLNGKECVRVEAS